MENPLNVNLPADLAEGCGDRNDDVGSPADGVLSEFSPYFLQCHRYADIHCVETQKIQVSLCSLESWTIHIHEKKEKKALENIH